MTADIGPICIDETAHHPARRKLIVVSALHCEKAPSAAKVTEARTVILTDLPENCARGAIYGAWGAPDTVRPGRLCIYIRVEEPNAPADANRKSGPGLDRRWRSIWPKSAACATVATSAEAPSISDDRPVDF